MSACIISVELCSCRSTIVTCLRIERVKMKENILFSSNRRRKRKTIINERGEFWLGMREEIEGRLSEDMQQKGSHPFPLSLLSFSLLLFLLLLLLLFFFYHSTYKYFTFLSKLILNSSLSLLSLSLSNLPHRRPFWQFAVCPLKPNSAIVIYLHTTS